MKLNMQFLQLNTLMSVLMQICEDVPQLLDSDITGLSERPINAFIPRFLQVLMLSFLVHSLPLTLSPPHPKKKA